MCPDAKNLWNPRYVCKQVPLDLRPWTNYVILILWRKAIFAFKCVTNTVNQKYSTNSVEVQIPLPLHKHLPIYQPSFANFSITWTYIKTKLAVNKNWNNNNIKYYILIQEYKYNQNFININFKMTARATNPRSRTARATIAYRMQ